MPTRLLLFDSKLRERPVAGATALSEMGYWMLELPVRTGGAPCGRGLTFFYSARGLALRAALRTFTSLREDVIRQKKVSKEKAMTAPAWFDAGTK